MAKEEKKAQRREPEREALLHRPKLGDRPEARKSERLKRWMYGPQAG
jgi:hypothetical protein